MSKVEILQSLWFVLYRSDAPDFCRTPDKSSESDGKTWSCEFTGALQCDAHNIAVQTISAASARSFTFRQRSITVRWLVDNPKRLGRGFLAACKSDREVVTNYASPLLYCIGKPASAEVCENESVYLCQKFVRSKRKCCRQVAIQS